MIKILILGGGFGGVRAALDLSKKFKKRNDVQITLVDKSDCQTFTPALYEVASIYGVDHEHPFHTKLRGVISIPYGEIFSSRGGSAFGGKNKKINLIQAEVNHIDLTAKHVVTNNGTTINFDYLVMALGSAASTFGVPGAQEYAFKFKTVEDSLMVADKLEELYLSASQKGRSLPINILVCGAGFNGVELAAELSNCTVHIAHKHAITQQNCTSITLIEAGPQILPMVSEKERNLITKRLKGLGINLLVNSPIEEVGPSRVKIKGGATLAGDLIVWSAGLQALDIFKSVVGLELNDRGRIIVNEFLQTKNKNVFGIGDNIHFVDPATQKPIPQMAFLAIEQGRVAAENVARMIRGGSGLKKYKPNYNVWIAPIGGKYAVAHIGSWNFSGFFGYVLRELVDLRYFLSVLPFFNAIFNFYRGVRVFSKND